LLGRGFARRKMCDQLVARSEVELPARGHVLEPPDEAAVAGVDPALQLQHEAARLWMTRLCAQDHVDRLPNSIEIAAQRTARSACKSSRIRLVSVWVTSARELRTHVRRAYLMRAEDAANAGAFSHVGVALGQWIATECCVSCSPLRLHPKPLENTIMQTLRFASRTAVTLVGALLATAALVATAAPRIQTGPSAEVTEDGLYRVDGGTFDRAWVKPGFNLDGYTKILLHPIGMSFREVDDPVFRRSASDFPVEDEQRQGLQKIFEEAFLAELAKSSRFTVTDQPGPGVLEIDSALVDIVSHVPDQQPVGRGGVFLKTLGEATLVIELRDSETHEILSRIADRRAAEAAFPTRSNEVSNRAEVRRATQQWASLLRRRLDEVRIL
jgi:hypothetical protein